MRKQSTVVILLVLLAASAAASDDPGPGGKDIRVNEFAFKGSVGPWKHKDTYPMFWIRPWRQGHEVLVAERSRCGTDKASRPRAKLEGKQLGLWIDLQNEPLDRGQCEYRILFKINNLPAQVSPVILNGVYGIPQQGWPER